VGFHSPILSLPSLVALLLLLLVVLGGRRGLLLDLRFELLEALELALEDVLFPDEHFVELTVGDHDLVQAAQVLRVRVHHTQDPQPVILDCLDGVSVQGQRLKIVETVKLLSLVQVADVVTVQVQSLELRKLKQIILNGLNVVVTQIQPEQVFRVPHDVDQNLGQVHDGPNLVVLQKQGCCHLSNDDFLLGFCDSLFDFAATHWT
jgi:hypothetical protein